MHTYIHELPGFRYPAASPYIRPNYPFGVIAKAECRTTEFELYGTSPGEQKTRLSYDTYAVLADVSLRGQTLYPTVWGTLTEVFPHLGWEKIRHTISPPAPRKEGIFLNDGGQPLEHADYLVVIGEHMYAVNPKPDQTRFTDCVFHRRVDRPADQFPRDCSRPTYTTGRPGHAAQPQSPSAPGVGGNAHVRTQ